MAGRRDPARGVPPSGVYLLFLWLRRSRRIRVGALGQASFPGGLYLYAGSGRRALRSRLRRHARRVKPPRWHIDYLRRHARLLGAAVVPWAPGRECVVARAGLGSPGARAVVQGFGASDCGCFAHLVRLEVGGGSGGGKRREHAMKTGAKKTGRNDLKTLAAVAKELGASPAALREAAQEARIVPDVVRCGCAYYGAKAQAALRRLAKG